MLVGETFKNECLSVIFNDEQQVMDADVIDSVDSTFTDEMSLLWLSGCLATSEVDFL